MRPRFSRRRFVSVAATIATVGQLPGLGLLAVILSPLLGSGAWAAAGCWCALASLPLAVRLYLGQPERTERGAIGALLVVFYGWWATSVFAGLLSPIAYGVAWAAGATSPAAACGALGAGALIGIAGVTLHRMVATLTRLEVRVEGLPASLDGYTIAQLSDLHMGGHTPPGRVRSWVDRVNRLEPDLVAVTGDLITSGDAFLERVAEELGRLRGRDGVALCMGNHDYFGDHRRLVVELERTGIDVLRNRGRVIEARGARFWLCGVDDTWAKRDDVGQALAGCPEGMISIVLAHDPLLFDQCAQRGATLVLSGHTHGGQVALPLFPRLFNIARLRYREVAGYYRRGGSHLFVSRGAGTTGPPLRIGSPSEIALITLRAA